MEKKKIEAAWLAMKRGSIYNNEGKKNNKKKINKRQEESRIRQPRSQNFSEGLEG